ncbi:MAG: acyl-CoA dehydrogenase family protein [Fidelibacterota bacterium]|nr:MAG: acyl-CoA dehydrogenase family protein [Candidatus Neomarinimicrobiota bacterium]
MSKNKPSIMKSIFQGEILEDLAFPYPNIDEDEADMVKIITDNFLKWAGENYDPFEADEQAAYPEGTLEALAEMGVFGLNVPESYGGLGLSQTAFARVYEAISSIDGSLPTMVGGHSSIGVKGLLLYGTDEQKRKYLPDLASGKKLAAFAITEPGAGSDAAAIQTRAVRQSDGTWVLNGQKQWITNGGIADFFTIFAKMEVEVNGKKEDKISAFIVDWGLEGFSRGGEEHKMGIRASSTVPLFFDNLVLPADSLLGDEGSGFKLAMEVLNSGRLGLAAGIVGGVKTIIREASKHARERQQFGRPIAEFEVIQGKIARMTVDTYVAESMVYLTTSLADRGDVDYSLESAICKVFASERVWEAVNEGLQVMGGLGYMKEYPFERGLRDARINLIFEGTNEILRLFIALTGIKAPGAYLEQLGKALRDPIKGFGFLADYAFTRAREAVSSHHLAMVHPALKKWADHFTHSVVRFHLVLNSAIMKFGKRVIDRQLMLKRFADTAIDLFGMLAVLSRVTSRIEAVGEEMTRSEIDITCIYCEEAWRRIRRNLHGIRRNQDHSVRQLATHISDHRYYNFPL